VPYAIPLNVLQGYNVFTPQNVIPLQRGDFFALSQTVGKVAIDRSAANPNRVGDMWLGAGGQPMAAAGKLTANYSYLQWVFDLYFWLNGYPFWSNVTPVLQGLKILITR